MGYLHRDALGGNDGHYHRHNRNHGATPSAPGRGRQYHQPAAVVTNSRPSPNITVSRSRALPLKRSPFSSTVDVNREGGGFVT